MNPRKKICCISIDNPLRDLPSNVFLASKLVDDEFDCYLCPMNFLEEEVYAINPDYILLNYLRINNGSMVTRLKKAGYQLGVLDTEGGVFAKIGHKTADNSFFSTIVKEQETRFSIDSYFVWGRKLYQMLLEKKLYKNLILSGAPKTDLYFGYKNGKVNKLSTQISNRYGGKPIILINSSFPLVIPKYQSAEKEKAQLVNMFQFEPDYVESLFQNLQVVLSDFIELANKLGEKFPEAQIIYRPHPFEDESFYQDKFKSPNIEMVKEHAVDAWLLASTCLIHFECSTAIESVLLNRPAFALEKHKSIREVQEVQAITHYCGNEQDLFVQIEACLQQAYKAPVELQSQIQSVISSIFFQVDGKASERISLEIKRVAREGVSRRSAWETRKGWILSKAKNILKERVYPRECKRDKLFTPSEVLRLFDSIEIPTDQFLVSKVGCFKSVRIQKNV